MKIKKHTAADKETAAKNDFVVHQLHRDVRDAILVVSVVINAYVFIAWLVLQVTTRYDVSLISYLQNR